MKCTESGWYIHAPVFKKKHHFVVRKVSERTTKVQRNEKGHIQITKIQLNIDIHPS